MIEKESPYGDLKRVAFISAAIEKFAPESLLDVGCGTGLLLTVPLARAWPNVSIVGVDADEATIAFAAAHHDLPNLTFSLRTPEAQRFDLIIASEVLEHVEDPIAFLADLGARLAEHGALIVTVPNGCGAFELANVVQNLMYFTGLYWLVRCVWRLSQGRGPFAPSMLQVDQAMSLAVSPHINFFTRKSLERLFSAAGFSIVAARARTVVCGFGWDLAVNALGLAQRNADLADRMPLILSSDWMYLVKPAARAKVTTPYQRGWTARLRRFLNEKRYGVRKPRKTIRGEIVDRIHHIITVPPSALMSSALRRLRRSTVDPIVRARRKIWPTLALDDMQHPLTRILLAPTARELSPLRETLAALAGYYRDHRFDILGSGWTRVAHGRKCPGLEKVIYQSDSTVDADHDGLWLKGRVTDANLATAQAIWRMIDYPYVPIDWQRDIRSGYRWDEINWFRDIGQPPMSADVKVPWEMARCHHFPQLALVYAAGDVDEEQFGATESLRSFRNQLLDFAATNPPEFGVNWVGPMDVAIRAVNWLVAYDLFRAAGATFDPDFERVLTASIRAHGRYIATHLESRGPFIGNHYLAAVVGLLFIGAYLPRSPESNRWLRQGIEQLRRQVMRQFHADGSNFECSTSYHRLSAEMAVWGTAIALTLTPERRKELRLRTEGDGSLFTSGYVDRLERMIEFTRDLTKPSARIVQIGDNDSGRLLKLGTTYTRTTVGAARRQFSNLIDYSDADDSEVFMIEDSLDHRHLVACGAVLFSRGDLAAFAGSPWPDAIVLKNIIKKPLPSRKASTRLGGSLVGTEPKLLREASDLPAKQRRVREFQTIRPGLQEKLQCAAYPDFGIYIMSSRRLFASIRCGGVDPNAWNPHTHNDQLAIELSIDGRDVVVDPGTFLYTPAPEWRNRYRSAFAHDVPVAPMDEEHSLRYGLFRLRPGATSAKLTFEEGVFIGEYREHDRIVYRAVIVNDAGVRVVDWVIGHGAEATIWHHQDSLPFSPAYGWRESRVA